MKSLPCKDEDLSSGPQPMKEGAICSPAVGTSGDWQVPELPGQSAWPLELQVQCQVMF